jgi:ligand-binding sensor domain-containing protein/signal transduction histidine kinase
MLPVFRKRSNWLLVLLRLGVLLAFVSGTGVLIPRQTVFAVEQRDAVLRSDPLQTPKYERISTQQGLPASQIYCILEDSLGYLWFGTEDGLGRFDGYDFIVFRPDPNDPSSLSDRTILSLYEDSLGRLWIGTEKGGLNRYDRSTGRFIRYITDPAVVFSLSDNTVLAIQQDSLGQIWIATNNGLNRFNDESSTFQRYSKNLESSAGISNEHVNALAADPRGGMWVGTADGLDYFDLASGKFTHFRYDRNSPSSLGNNQVAALWLDPAGILWVGTSRGLEHLDPSIKRFSHYRYDPSNPYSLGDNSVLSIMGDHDGTIWVGTQQGGVNRYYNDLGAFFRDTNHPDDPYSLSSNMVFAIYEDKSGLVWVGTDSGLSKFDPLTLRFPHYRHIPNDPNSLAGDDVQAIYQDRALMLWVGTDKGLDRLDPTSGQFTHYLHDEYNPTSLAQDVVTCVLEDRDGNIWVGTKGGGLDRLDLETGQFAHFREEPGSLFGPNTDYIRALYEDKDGNLWVGTNGAGLKRLDQASGQFTHYGLVEEDANMVVSIFQDSRETLWIGTYAGLGRFNPENGQLELVRFEGNNPARLAGYKILVIQEGSQGTLWLGTLGGGLLNFDPQTGEVKAYLEQDGLANNVVYGILEAGDGQLWLSTNKGLTRFDPVSGAFKNFDVKDGAQSNEFNPGAFFRGANGDFYFGGVHGFNVFNPLQIEENTYMPPIVLTSLTQNGVPIQPKGELETIQEVILRWPSNYFEFEYAALSYRQSDENQYAYQLGGFDERWNQVGSRRYGQYTNLPGGTYTLHIRGSNNDGLWNETGMVLKITVVPPWWEMDWFRWGAPFALVLVIFGGYYLRLRGIQRRNRQLAEEVEDRTREIEQRRQVAEGLREVLVRLNSSQALGETLAFIVAQANRLTGSYRAILFELKSGDNPLLTAFAESGTNATQEQNFSRIQIVPLLAWMAGVLKKDSPSVLRDLPNLPRQRKPPSHLLLEDVHTLVLTPVLAGGRLFGGLAVMYPARHFSQEDILVLTSLADQAALAVENEDLRLKAEQLAIVSERARLARDLHDAVTQSLFSASLISEALPALWHKNEQDGLQLLQELRQLTRGALAEMRNLLMELRPSAVIEVRLSDLLYQLGESVTGRTGLPVRLDLREGARLPDDVHICFYRIAQETLTNVVKHAQATEISLSLTYSLPDYSGELDEQAEEEIVRVCLEICDNGLGFEVSSVPPDHFGLMNIRERAQAIGADLTVTSQVGQGTRVRVVWTGKVNSDE